MKRCEVNCSCTMEIQETEERNACVPENYGEIRNLIFAKLINTHAHMEQLADLPNRAVLDLSLIFYFFRDNDPDGEEIPVTNAMLQQWEVDDSRIFSDAMMNTRNIMGESIRPLKEVIDDLLKDLSPETDASGDDRLPMYVLTNLWKRNGAICILYGDAVKELAETLDSDLYVIPSSIHEMILVPAEQGVSREELDTLIREINETELAKEDVLSDHSYYFSRKLEHLVM